MSTVQLESSGYPNVVTQQLLADVAVAEAEMIVAREDAAKPEGQKNSAERMIKIASDIYKRLANTLKAVPALE